MVKASVGRFGPYVLHDRKYVSIKVPERVLDIEMDEAVELIATRPRRRAGQPQDAQGAGRSPGGRQARAVLDGAYGPYVKHGRINATLPKDQVPEEVTMEQAVEWIEAKAAKKGKKKTTKKKAAKKTTKKKTTKKKTAKKKATKKTAAKAAEAS